MLILLRSDRRIENIQFIRREGREGKLVDGEKRGGALGRMGGEPREKGGTEVRPDSIFAIACWMEIIVFMNKKDCFRQLQ